MTSPHCSCCHGPVGGGDQTTRRCRSCVAAERLARPFDLLGYLVLIGWVLLAVSVFLAP